MTAWLIIGVVIPYTQFLRDKYNNYIIFKNGFLHLLEEQSLYASYAHEGLDVFLYGPLAAVLMAPFTLFPDRFGCLLFLLTSALLLYVAIQSIPISAVARNGICLLCLIELGNNQQHFQTNAFAAALIILTLTLIIRSREIPAALSVIVGVFTKLYGLIALPFFLFSKRKGTFMVALVGGLLLAFVLPMLFSSWSFVLDSYVEWFNALTVENEINLELGGFQDKSIFGLIARVAQRTDIPQWPILLVGCALFAYPYLPGHNRYSEHFYYLALASALMFVVLFSSSSENPTYIIMQCGIAIWCCAGSRLPRRARVGIMVGVIVLSSLSPTDAYPEVIRDFYANRSLRVLPCAFVWVITLCEMVRCRRDGS